MGDRTRKVTDEKRCAWRVFTLRLTVRKQCEPNTLRRRSQCGGTAKGQPDSSSELHSGIQPQMRFSRRNVNVRKA
jgi:hypothetical protein